jgi:regulator of sigma E protease
LPVIGDVEPDSAAFHAGFERGQTIVAVDGEPTPTQYRLHMQLINRIGETGVINFDLRYPESTALYQASLPIDNWLAGDDRPEIYGSLGFGYFYPEMPALIERVVEGGPADVAGILAGDRITAIDGIAVKDWRAAVEQIKGRPLQPVEVELLRDGGTVNTVVNTQAITLDDGVQHGRIGVQAAAVELPASMMVVQRYGPLEALYQGFARTGELIAFTFGSIKKMLMGLISTSSLSGPVSIAKMASATASSGFIPYMEFLALLSVSLGVLNLLPIPVLDGGHLMYIGIEAITRRPVSERLQIWGQQLGLVLILSIMALALYNDISHF